MKLFSNVSLTGTQSAPFLRYFKSVFSLENRLGPTRLHFKSIFLASGHSHHSKDCKPRDFSSLSEVMGSHSHLHDCGTCFNQVTFLLCVSLSHVGETLDRSSVEQTEMK